MKQASFIHEIVYTEFAFEMEKAYLLLWLEVIHKSTPTPIPIRNNLLRMRIVVDVPAYEHIGDLVYFGELGAQKRVVPFDSREFLLNGEDIASNEFLVVVYSLGLGAGADLFGFTEEGFLLAFLFPPDLHQRLSRVRRGVHIALSEVFVFEVEVVTLLFHFVNLAEMVHIQLSDEGFDFVVPEKQR